MVSQPTFGGSVAFCTMRINAQGSYVPCANPLAHFYLYSPSYYQKYYDYANGGQICSASRMMGFFHRSSSFDLALSKCWFLFFYRQLDHCLSGSEVGRQFSRSSNDRSAFQSSQRSLLALSQRLGLDHSNIGPHELHILQLDRSTLRWTSPHAKCKIAFLLS